MILDYIEQAGKGKYQCFKTKKICLDSVDNDTIAYNYDDKTIANATKSTFAETDHSRVKTVSKSAQRIKTDAKNQINILLWKMYCY